jgi:hypothetical protein
VPGLRLHPPVPVTGSRGVDLAACDVGPHSEHALLSVHAGLSVRESCVLTCSGLVMLPALPA